MPARTGTAPTRRRRFDHIGRFLKIVGAFDPPVTSVEELTPEAWKSWKARRAAATRDLRVVVRELPSLRADTRAVLDQRRRTIKPKTRTLKTGFTQREMHAVRTAAARTVRAARLRIAENTALMERWRSGQIQAGTMDWRWGELLDQLSRTGDVPRFPSGPTRPASRALTSDGGFMAACARLWPYPWEIGAAAVLLICHESWNLSVVKKLQLPQQWPNADENDPDPAIFRMDTDKKRRPRLRFNSNNLVNAGEGTAGAAMKQIIEMTDQARVTMANMGTPTTALLVTRKLPRGGGYKKGLFRTCEDGQLLGSWIADWSQRTKAEGVDLPHVTARLTRHTAQALYGRARNNTDAVNDADYLMKDTTVREESRTVVETGLTAAMSHAFDQVKMRMVADATGTEPHDAELVAKHTGLPRDTAADVVAGQLQTPVASCTDFDHSPFTPAGPCSVSFLLCLACPNALATGRDLPRIVYLHRALETLRSAVSGSVWQADWAAHHMRVSDFLTTHTSESARPELLAQVAERDRHLIDRMLDRRLDS
ncbi:hypothetical protein [Streptomyces sp. ISL-100]|uniref:hypothetical protein n=1 Tax=Streptomyces sp. ISL-100 TaxID=2819173 RepID=UPI001BEB1E8E|nr:hypothetical protein [Streptomyces sp. ISL-100]MBT2401470.1 hypothetical protein [Streptomyces sp. ISL-100]